MDKEGLRELANKRRLTAADKEAIKGALDTLGIAAPDCACPDAWRDKAVEAYAVMNADSKEQGVWMLKGDSGKGCYFRGIYASNATMTDDLHDTLVSLGFPESLFNKKDE